MVRVGSLSRRERNRLFLSLLPRVNSPRDFLTGYVVPVLGVYLFWLYCNKFLGMSIGYLSTMAGTSRSPAPR